MIIMISCCSNVNVIINSCNEGHIYVLVLDGWTQTDFPHSMVDFEKKKVRVIISLCF